MSKYVEELLKGDRTLTLKVENLQKEVKKLEEENRVLRIENNELRKQIENRKLKDDLQTKRLNNLLLRFFDDINIE